MKLCIIIYTLFDITIFLSINNPKTKKYNINQELAILRQRDTKPTEFTEYSKYVEKCKAEVKNELKEKL